MVFGHHGYAVSAFKLFKGGGDGGGEIPFVELLNKVRNHFAVGGGKKLVAVFDQRSLRTGKIVYNAVMHDGKFF